MPTGIDFIIGGKSDGATSAMDKVDQSLGRLQARTGQLATATKEMAVRAGGAKASMGGLSTGAAAIAGAAKSGQAGIAGLTASLGKLKAVAGPLLAVFAAVKTVTAGVGAIRDAAAAYDEQAESIRGLESALAAGFGPADGMSEKLQEAARNLENLTGVSERTTAGLMKQASHLGVHSSQLDEVARAAIGLAEATGKDLTEATNMAAAAVKGDFSAFSQLIPQINMATTAEQKLAMVQQLSAKGMALKASQSESLAGITDRAGNAIRRLMESVGALLAPMRMLIASGVRSLAESLQGALGPAVERAKVLVDGLGPAMAAVGDTIRAVVQVGKVYFEVFTGIIKTVGEAVAGVFGVQFSTAASTFTTIAEGIRDVAVSIANRIIAALTWIEVVVQNIGPVWEMMKASAELQLIRLLETIKHTFTVAIPTYAAWFARNFTNIVRDAFVGIVTIVANAMQNVADAVVRVWQFVASGGKDGLGKLMTDLGSIATRSLLEGFESSTESLPEVAARKITEREKQLSEKIGDIGAELGQKFTDKFSERMITLGDDVAKNLPTDLSLNMQANVHQSQAKLQAQEGRLIGRGPAEKREDYMRMIAQNTEETAKAVKAVEGAQMASASELAEIRSSLASAPRIQMDGVN